MAECKQCGNPVGLFTSLCVDCIAANKRAAESILAAAAAESPEDSKATNELRALMASAKKVILSTETTLSSPDMRRLGLVTGTCIYGQHLGRDLATSFTDLVGGRSKVSEKLYTEARNQALDDLRLEAAKLGATMVFALSVEHREISSGGKSMVMVTAIGTASDAEQAS